MTKKINLEKAHCKSKNVLDIIPLSRRAFFGLSALVGSLTFLGSVGGGRIQAWADESGAKYFTVHLLQDGEVPICIWNVGGEGVNDITDGAAEIGKIALLSQNDIGDNETLRITITASSIPDEYVKQKKNDGTKNNKIILECSKTQGDNDSNSNDVYFYPNIKNCSVPIADGEGDQICSFVIDDSMIADDEEAEVSYYMLTGSLEFSLGSKWREYRINNYNIFSGKPDTYTLRSGLLYDLEGNAYDAITDLTNLNKNSKIKVRHPESGDSVELKITREYEDEDKEKVSGFTIDNADELRVNDKDSYWVTTNHNEVQIPTQRVDDGKPYIRCFSIDGAELQYKKSSGVLEIPICKFIKDDSVNYLVEDPSMVDLSHGESFSCKANSDDLNPWKNVGDENSDSGLKYYYNHTIEIEIAVPAWNPEWNKPEETTNGAEGTPAQNNESTENSSKIDQEKPQYEVTNISLVIKNSQGEVVKKSKKRPFTCKLEQSFTTCTGTSETTGAAYYTATFEDTWIDGELINVGDTLTAEFTYKSTNTDVEETASFTSFMEFIYADPSMLCSEIITDLTGTSLDLENKTICVGDTCYNPLFLYSTPTTMPSSISEMDEIYTEEKYPEIRSFLNHIENQTDFDIQPALLDAAAEQGFKVSTLSSLVDNNAKAQAIKEHQAQQKAQQKALQKAREEAQQKAKLAANIEDDQTVDGRMQNVPYLNDSFPMFYKVIDFFKYYGSFMTITPFPFFSTAVQLWADYYGHFGIMHVGELLLAQWNKNYAKKEWEWNNNVGKELSNGKWVPRQWGANNFPIGFSRAGYGNKGLETFKQLWAENFQARSKYWKTKAQAAEYAKDPKQYKAGFNFTQINFLLRCENGIIASSYHDYLYYGDGTDHITFDWGFFFRNGWNIMILKGVYWTMGGFPFYAMFSLSNQVFPQVFVNPDGGLFDNTVKKARDRLRTFYNRPEIPLGLGFYIRYYLEPAFHPGMGAWGWCAFGFKIYFFSQTLIIWDDVTNRKKHEEELGQKISYPWWVHRLESKWEIYIWLTPFIFKWIDCPTMFGFNHYYVWDSRDPYGRKLETNPNLPWSRKIGEWLDDHWPLTYSSMSSVNKNSFITDNMLKGTAVATGSWKESSLCSVNNVETVNAPSYKPKVRSGSSVFALCASDGTGAVADARDTNGTNVITADDANTGNLPDLSNPKYCNLLDEEDTSIDDTSRKALNGPMLKPNYEQCLQDGLHPFSNMRIVHTDIQTGKSDTPFLVRIESVEIEVPIHTSSFASNEVNYEGHVFENTDLVVDVDEDEQGRSSKVVPRECASDKNSSASNLTSTSAGGTQTVGRTRVCIREWDRKKCIWKMDSPIILDFTVDNKGLDALARLNSHDIDFDVEIANGSLIFAITSVDTAAFDGSYEEACNDYEKYANKYNDENDPAYNKSKSDDIVSDLRYSGVDVAKIKDDLYKKSYISIVRYRFDEHKTYEGDTERTTANLVGVVSANTLYNRLDDNVCIAHPKIRMQAFRHNKQNKNYCVVYSYMAYYGGENKDCLYDAGIVATVFDLSFGYGKDLIAGPDYVLEPEYFTNNDNAALYVDAKDIIEGKFEVSCPEPRSVCVSNGLDAYGEEKTKPLEIIDEEGQSIVEAAPGDKTGDAPRTAAIITWSHIGSESYNLNIPNSAVALINYSIQTSGVCEDVEKSVSIEAYKTYDVHYRHIFNLEGIYNITNLNATNQAGVLSYVEAERDVAGKKPLQIITYDNRKQKLGLLYNTNNSDSTVLQQNQTNRIDYFTVCGGRRLYSVNTIDSSHHGLSYEHMHEAELEEYPESTRTKEEYEAAVIANGEDDSLYHRRRYKKDEDGNYIMDENGKLKDFQDKDPGERLAEYLNPKEGCAAPTNACTERDPFHPPCENDTKAYEDTQVYLHQILEARWLDDLCMYSDFYPLAQIRNAPDDIDVIAFSDGYATQGTASFTFVNTEYDWKDYTEKKEETFQEVDTSENVQDKSNNNLQSVSSVSTKQPNTAAIFQVNIPLVKQLELYSLSPVKPYISRGSRAYIKCEINNVGNVPISSITMTINQVEIDEKGNITNRTPMETKDDNDKTMHEGGKYVFDNLRNYYPETFDIKDNVYDVNGEVMSGASSASDSDSTDDDSQGNEVGTNTVQKTGILWPAKAAKFTFWFDVPENITADGDGNVAFEVYISDCAAAQTDNGTNTCFCGLKPKDAQGVERNNYHIEIGGGEFGKDKSILMADGVQDNTKFSSADPESFDPENYIALPLFANASNSYVYEDEEKANLSALSSNGNNNGDGIAYLESNTCVMTMQNPTRISNNENVTIRGANYVVVEAESVDNGASDNDVEENN